MKIQIYFLGHPDIRAKDQRDPLKVPMIRVIDHRDILSISQYLYRQFLAEMMKNQFHYLKPMTHQRSLIQRLEIIWPLTLTNQRTRNQKFQFSKKRQKTIPGRKI